MRPRPHNLYLLHSSLKGGQSSCLKYSVNCSKIPNNPLPTQQLLSSRKAGGHKSQCHYSKSMILNKCWLNVHALTSSKNFNSLLHSFLLLIIRILNLKLKVNMGRWQIGKKRENSLIMGAHWHADEKEARL